MSTKKSAHVTSMSKTTLLPASYLLVVAIPIVDKGVHNPPFIATTQSNHATRILRQAPLSTLNPSIGVYIYTSQPTNNNIASSLSQFIPHATRPHMLPTYTPVAAPLGLVPLRPPPPGFGFP